MPPRRSPSMARKPPRRLRPFEWAAAPGHRPKGTMMNSLPTAASPESRPADQTQRLRRVVSASLVGTTIEWYDFFVYASAAGLVFGPQFFPALDGANALLASFATLGVSF